MRSIGHGFLKRWHVPQPHVLSKSAAVGPRLHSCIHQATQTKSNQLLRSYYTLALTRQVPDSFGKAISIYSATVDPISVSLAKSQHEAYIELLRTQVPTISLPSLEAHPDSVFVEDTVVAHKKRAVITCPGHTSRQGEVDSIEEALEQLGMDIVRMQDGALCDGGDVLNTGRHMFVGLSDRTNHAGAAVLQDVFGDDNLQVIPVPMDSQDALHLKSIATHIDDVTLLAPTGVVGDKLLTAMKAEELGYRIVRLPDITACNVVSVNGLILVSNSSCEESKEQLQKKAQECGMDLHFVETTEVNKADGAVTCCSVLLSL